MIFLTLEELLRVAGRVVSPGFEVRDIGLLESAAVRPQASAFGTDAYPTIHDKAAALVHSLARNHPLMDGNKRLSLGGLIAFYGFNGQRLTLTNDEAYHFIIAVASGDLDEVAALSAVLSRSTRAW